jgi:hypothetical protein
MPRSMATLASCLTAALVVAPLTPLALRDAAGQTTPPAAPAAARDENNNLAQLPIKNIVLYRSGVGYFQRAGTVTGVQAASLSFQTDHINDILKSMVLLDLDGGRIDAVTYNSKEPLSRRLASFGVNIGDSPSIAALLQQLRGSAVTIDGPDGDVEGTILGVERRLVTPAAASTDAAPAAPLDDFVTIVTSRGIRAVRISAISSFSFKDPALNDELAKALAALAEQRTENVKSVDLSFTGDPGAQRRIVVAYVHEMPVWKASYRLVIPDTGSGAPDEKIPMTLQGWALVENTTDHDWDGVNLSLASGRPVSFTMDLYEPLYTPRPRLPVPVMAGVLPRIYEAATNRQSFASGGAGFYNRQAAPASAASDLAETNMMRRGDLSFSGESADASAAISADDLAKFAASSQATAGLAGETFLYTLDAPVSLERQRSAMLPILTAPVQGQRVSIYNSAVMPASSMRGVRFDNDSGLHLMPGPISVSDGPAYAGDAQIPHTSRDQTRIISYSVDLDVQCDTRHAPESNLTKLRIVDGVLELTTKQLSKTFYTFTNNDSTKPRLMLVEHARDDAWELIEPAKAAETTQNLYRFEVPIEAGKSATLGVTTQRISRTTVALTSYNLDQLMSYTTDGRASKAVLDAARAASAINARIVDVDRQIAALVNQRGSITSDQSRIRDNMSGLDRNSELYRRYTTKLAEQETTLETLQTQETTLRQAKTAAESELATFLRDLDVE